MRTLEITQQIIKYLDEHGTVEASSLQKHFMSEGLQRHEIAGAICHGINHGMINLTNDFMMNLVK